MTIGDRIRNARIEKGMEQTELAIKAGVIKQTLYKYERNIITNIPSDKIETISEALGVSPAYLMGWEDNLNENASDIIPDILSDSELLESIQKLMQLNDEHKDKIYNDIAYWYEKEGH